MLLSTLLPKILSMVFTLKVTLKVKKCTEPMSSYLYERMEYQQIIGYNCLWRMYIRHNMHNIAIILKKSISECLLSNTDKR